ncbi:MAG TPA: potassium transporter Kup [Solirubrobacteraceae bacterium]|nr:potassium transporter Kup [Solirubrobacteraceae bacterium]
MTDGASTVAGSPRDRPEARAPASGSYDDGAEASAAGEGRSGGGAKAGTATAKDGGKQSARRGAGAALTISALGVVFGDIGTSPLYALTSVFQVHGVKPDSAGVYGMISLVVWTIVLVVSVKYVAFVMRADNQGEGGIMALVALVRELPVKDRRVKAVLVAIGILGVALFFGDGTVTPAISVISSVEGLKVAVPGVTSLVVPITLALLTLLFGYQHFGTHAIGRLFGPTMALWFLLLAVTGGAKVAQSPGILKALSPTYGIAFFAGHPGVGFLSLGAVVLVVTGAEALYADLGQFDRRSIRRGWFFVVFPALLINYLGQGALILGDPKAIATPFFGLMPKWAEVPMVVVAVLATMIASQAVITGAFSVTRQAVRLGFLPRMQILHKSGSEGQVYVPAINWLLYVAVVGLVVGFGSSTALASAYGIAVTGTFVTTTLLFFALVRMRWHKPLWIVLAGAAVFLILDLSFFSANLTKVASGGWFPLVIGLLIFTLLTTWQRGRELVTDTRSRTEGLLRDFVEKLRRMDPPPYRAPGTAVCLSAGKQTTPLALRENLAYNDVLHERVVIVSVATETVPHVDLAEQIVVDDLDCTGDDLIYLTIRYGFQDSPDVPAALLRATEQGMLGDLDIENAIYFVSEITLVRGDDPGLRPWRKRLFLLLARTSRSPVDAFHLPKHRTVTMGSYIEL